MGGDERKDAIDEEPPLPPHAQRMCDRVVAAGGEVATWRAYGRPFAAASRLAGIEGAALRAELLASGWGRYNEAVAVWGWKTEGEAR